MTDIELVVKLPRKVYEQLVKYSEPLPRGNTFDDAIMKAVANGKQLPKGHGELKDADVMINKLCTHEASELFGSTTCAEILDFINNEKPIIKADKAESEDK